MIPSDPTAVATIVHVRLECEGAAEDNQQEDLVPANESADACISSPFSSSFMLGLVVYL